VSTRGYSRGMGRTSEILYHRRRDEFLGPISMIARNSAAVHEIIDLYARGDIVTKEEALSQMVKALAARCRDSEEEWRRVYGIGQFDIQRKHPLRPEMAPGESRSGQ